MIFDELCKAFLKRKKTELAHSTHYEYELFISKHFACIAPLELSEITEEHILEIREGLKGYSAPRQRKVIILLKHLFKEAVEDGFISVSPAKKIKTPQAVRRNCKAYTPEEAHIISSAKDYGVMCVALTVALNTGLRRGELLALCWDDIEGNLLSDTPNGKISVCKALVIGENGCTVVNKTKTFQDRYIPINPHCFYALKSLYTSTDGKGYIFKSPIHPDKPIALSTFSHSYKVVMARLQGQNPELRYLTPHKLRHTFATHALMGGADIETVRQLMGHSSISTTQVYVHSTDDKLIKAVNNLPY